MALSKENPASLNRTEDLGSTSKGANPESMKELGGLVDLLVDVISDRQIEKPQETLNANNQQARELDGKKEDKKNAVPELGALAPAPLDGNSDTEKSDEINLSENFQSFASEPPPIPASSSAAPAPLDGSSDTEKSDEIDLNENFQSSTSEPPPIPASSSAAPAPLDGSSDTEKSDEINLNETFESAASEPPPIPASSSAAPASLDSSDFPKLIESGVSSGENLLKSDKDAEDTRPLPERENLPEVKQGEDSANPFEQLQYLLVGPELGGIRTDIASLNENIEKIAGLLGDREQLIELLLPTLAELLSRKVTMAKEEISSVIAPIIDEVISQRSKQDKTAMSAAIASVLPTAISQQIRDYPEEIAKAIAPEIALAIEEQIKLKRDAISNVLAPQMGAAIKAQIELERDAMVDALYPVIGNTISKYMVETIRAINEQISNTLSVKGVRRKIRSKVQGVSEAELILKEAMPFTVQAIFLIHKASGLVISEVQRSDSHSLESEMVAGMLTAIRSFVNDCIVQAGEVSELNQIEYGDSKIILEVGGYCYLAVVIKGESPKEYIQKMRQTLGNIILKYGKPIELFDGDPAKIPGGVQTLLLKLMETGLKQQQTDKPPVALMAIGAAILSLIVLPWGVHQYRSSIARRIEAEANLGLVSAPELSVYRLFVKSDGETLKLTGRVPNEYLRSRAAQIAQQAAPNLKLDNQIIAVEVPADPVQTAAEVKRAIALFNQMDNVSISGTYANGKVTVEGSVFELADAKKITAAFEKIPGVRSVTNALQIQPVAIAARIYFDAASDRLNSPLSLKKIIYFKEFLNENPGSNMAIVGHGDTSGLTAENQHLATSRALAVRAALVAMGIDPKRLQVKANTNFAAQGNAKQGQSLSRSVIVQIITKDAKSQ